MAEKIYLDSNASTAVAPEVIEAMTQHMAACPGNPSSVHSFGQEAKKYLIEARDCLAALLAVKPKEITFTSGGSEALNLALRGFASTKPGCHIITSDVEHPAVNKTVQDLENKGHKVTYLKAGSWGAIRAEDLQEAIQEDTGLIALMAANNETGVKTDLEAIGKIAQAKGIPFVVDAIAFVGKEALHISPGVSALCLSAHKFHGPKGVGALFLRQGIKIPAQLTGGGHEAGLRAGTENLPGIVGLGKACQLLVDNGDDYFEKIAERRDRLEKGILEKIPHAKVNGDGPRVANTVNIAFPGLDNESLLIQFDLAGVMVSAGSACSSGALEPSRVLLKMGIPHELANGSVRLSVSRYNSIEEIDRAVEIITQVVKALEKQYSLRT